MSLKYLDTLGFPKIHPKFATEVHRRVLEASTVLPGVSHSTLARYILNLKNSAFTEQLRQFAFKKIDPAYTEKLKHLVFKENDLLQFRGRDSKRSIVPKCFELLRKFASSSTLRVEAYRAIRRHIHDRFKKGIPLNEMVEDFRQIGTKSVYGSAHIVCLKDSQPFLQSKWKVNVLAETPKKYKVMFLEGMPKGLVTKVDKALVIQKKGDVRVGEKAIALALPAPCLTANELTLGSAAGKFANVPLIMAFKVEISKSSSHKAGIEREVAFYSLGNEMVKSRTCVNFPLVFEYGMERCSRIYKKSLFPEGQNCHTHHTHYTLNELASGDLYAWFREYGHGKATLGQLQGSYFQCMAGLTVMNEHWDVAHADAHGANFLYSDLEGLTDFVYDIPHNDRFWRIRLANQRHLFKVWDFGFVKKRPMQEKEPGFMNGKFAVDAKHIYGIYQKYSTPRAKEASEPITVLSSSYYGYLYNMAKSSKCPDITLHPIPRDEQWPTQRGGRPVIYSNLTKPSSKVRTLAAELLRSVNRREILKSRGIEPARPSSFVRRDRGSIVPALKRVEKVMPLHETTRRKSRSEIRTKSKSKSKSRSATLSECKATKGVTCTKNSRHLCKSPQGARYYFSKSGRKTYCKPKAKPKIQSKPNVKPRSRSRSATLPECKATKGVTCKKSPSLLCKTPRGARYYISKSGKKTYCKSR